MEIYYNFQTFILCIITLCLKFNNCKSVEKNLYSTQQFMERGLLVSTKKAVGLVFPRELGYEKDYKQIVFKIHEQPNDDQFFILDSIYDNRTKSIFIALLLKYKGSQILRLTNGEKKQNTSDYFIRTPKFEFNYTIASNWSIDIFYKNSSVTIEALDFNIKARKLYWLEVDNKFNNIWSFAAKKLRNKSSIPKYFRFNDGMFSVHDIHYLSVTYDNEKNIKKVKNNTKNDVIFFVSNEKTLHICFLNNITCQDYFKSAYFNESIILENNKKEKLITNSSSEFNLNEIVQKIESNYSSSHEFRKLLTIIYDQDEHSLYLSDLMSFEVKKLTFRKTSANYNDFTCFKIESILKANNIFSPLLPTSSLSYGNYIFWTNSFELKSSLPYYQSERFIDKIGPITNLRKF